MTALFPILLILIFLICVGMLYTEGMWGNAIRLVNVVTAALLASNFWEPLAGFLDGQNDSFTYYWDFLALWGLFALFLVIFRLATDFLSRVKVKFKKIADQVGSVFFAAWVGWVVVCFTVFSLHTAPLAKNFLWGAFDADTKMFMSLAPDRQWLGFMMKMSRGVFCRYGSDEELPKYGDEMDASGSDAKLCVFDREARFIPKYTARRVALEKYVGEKSATRVDSGGAPKR